MTVREISIALVLTMFACAGGLSIWQAKATAGLPRISLRTTGFLLILLAACVSLHWLAKRKGRMPAPVFSSKSPDGRFIVEIVEPDGDLIPTDQVGASVRRRGHFLAEEVFEGTIEPNIDWLGNHILELTYPVTSKITNCGGSWSGTTIICKQVPMTEFKPRLRE
jgi:hypothetical protein